MITVLTIILSGVFIVCGSWLGVRALNIALFLMLAGIVSIVIVKIISSIGEAEVNWKDIKFDAATFVLTLVLLAALLAGKSLM